MRSEEEVTRFRVRDWTSSRTGSRIDHPTSFGERDDTTIAPLPFVSSGTDRRGGGG